MKFAGRFGRVKEELCVDESTSRHGGGFAEPLEASSACIGSGLGSGAPSERLDPPLDRSPPLRDGGLVLERGALLLRGGGVERPKLPRQLLDGVRERRRRSSINCGNPPKAL